MNFRQPMSRREFITGNWFTRNRSGRPGETAEEHLRDNVIEKTGEMVAAAMILGLARTGSREKLVYYETAGPRFENDPDYERSMKAARQLNEVVGPIDDALDKVYAKWKEAYYTWREVCKPEVVVRCDSNNVCTTTVDPGCEIEYYWKEPWFALLAGVEHEKLEDMRRYTGGVKPRADDLINNGGKAFDLDRGVGEVTYPERYIDQKAQSKLAAIVYGLVGAGYVFYEEVDESVAKVSDNPPIIEGGRYMKRRTFLKLVASGLMYLGIREIQGLFAANNKNLRQEIEENSNRVSADMDVTDKENFRRFMGTTPEEMKEFIDSTQQAANTMAGMEGDLFDTKWAEIREDFGRLQGVCERARDEYNNLFNPNKTGVKVPEGLSRMMKNLWATRAINQFVDGRKVGLDVQHLVHALILALGLAAVTGVSEKAVFPAMDEIAERV